MAAMATKTASIPALDMRAAFEPSSINEEARTVEVVWTTGARVLRGYYDRFWEELSLDPKHVRLDRLNGGAPFLMDHDPGAVSRTPGVVMSARLEGKRGIAVIRFDTAENDPEADKLFRKIKSGIVTKVSVGYRVHKMEKTEDGADKIPVYRATDWEPYEISAVSLPADAGASFRSESPSNACTFITREESRTMDPEQIAAADKAAEEKRALEIKQAGEAAVKADRERSAAIKLAVRAAKLDDALAEDMISKGVSADAARAQVLEKLAARSEEQPIDGHSADVSVGEGEAEKWQRGAVAGLIRRTGFADVVRKADPKADVDGGEFRAMSLYDMARDALELRGVKTRGMSKDKLMGLALTRAGAGGYSSSSDFAIALENALHKTMQASYETQGDTWSRFCGTDSVSDFRDHLRYRMSSFAGIDALTEAGEFKNRAIPDAEKASLRVSTKGNIIAISRQSLINDDMGYFMGLAARFGRGARLQIELDVYAALGANGGLGPTQADAQPFFAAGRGNVGAGSALGVPGIDADRVLMASQKDPSNNEILDLRPSILLVPIGIGGDARVLNDSQYDVTVSNKFQVPNKVRGLFREVVDTPRLTGTRRYLFADNGANAAIKVAFLNGQQTPYFEQNEGWRTDGTEMKVRLDYGVNFFDARTALTNAGV